MEKQEVLRRRGLTEKEIIEENQRLVDQGLRPGKKEKSTLQFLQKYYHKGAFYMDDETTQKFEKETGKLDPRKKDYNEATADDRRNMELLPEVLQRRNFGKKSQTKWTHLSNEDTTKGENLWKEANRFNRKRSENHTG